ncbi:hypothetical protein CMV_011758 [Castanea mollissima]|uniref:Uncharacterized protein n=1 Tax=Castanea mollissima TaxID=60419 RepID=A0A8J4RGW7_9ROSI|nr:hypothetical protein CMV_011758 [Castanea mollissima]
MESLIDHHSSVQGLVLEGAGGGFGNKLLQDVSLYVSKIKGKNLKRIICVVTNSTLRPSFAVGIMHTCERSASVNNVQSASGL